MKLAIKNIFGNRKQYAWLWSELIAISVVSVILLDSVIIDNYPSIFPTNIKQDQIVIAETVQNTDFGKGNETEEETTAYAKKLKAQVESMEGVDKAYWIYLHIGIPLMDGAGYRMYRKQNPTDSIYCICFENTKEVFQMVGIEVAEGSPDFYKSDSIGMDYIVVTESFAKKFYGSTENAIGKSMPVDFWWEKCKNLIIGVAKDFRAQTNQETYYGALKFCEPKESGETLLLKLKNDQDIDEFVTKANANLGTLGCGTFRVTSLYKYSEASNPYLRVKNTRMAWYWNGRIFGLSYARVLFFFISLIIGVIGTFWLTTKQRSEEIGVMRAFGARKISILSMFLKEGFLITSTSMVIGVIIIINLMEFGSFHLDIPTEAQRFYDYSWVMNPTTHLIGISLVSYIILLTIVTIGISIPTYMACHMKPVDALRDE